MSSTQEGDCLSGNARPTAFITGCSSGLGLGLAVELGRRQWHVTASMRDVGRRGRLDRTWADAGLDPADLEVLALDVTVPVSIADATGEVARITAGAPDLLILNAGVGTMGFFEDLSVQDIRRVVDTNLLGAIEVAHALIGAMRERRSGRIVVVSSNAVNVAHPMMSVYEATKWAIEGWAEAMRLELASFGIEVMIAQPGAHRTEFGTNVRPILPAGSPYASIMAAVAPRLEWIGARQRDPELAVREIVDACERPKLPFRVRLGADAKFCAALTRYVPAQLRHELFRRFMGIPARAPIDQAASARRLSVGG
jgi:NAD(P)-dependent dehydrogenase (short-subunit alcohol dehydrogenase family)